MKKIIWHCLLVGVFIAAVQLPASAQGVGSNGPFETTAVLQPVISIPENPIYFIAEFGTEANPISIELNMKGTHWNKYISTDIYTVNQYNGRMVVGEYLEISGDLPWWGWSSVIDTPGFDFDITLPSWPGNSYFHPFADIYIWNGIGYQLLSDYDVIYHAATSISAPRLEYRFEPLLPGTKLHIVTGIILASPFDPFQGEITLRQYPFPEPSTILLMGFAVLGILKRRY